MVMAPRLASWFGCWSCSPPPDGDLPKGAVLAAKVILMMKRLALLLFLLLPLRGGAATAVTGATVEAPTRTGAYLQPEACLQPLGKISSLRATWIILTSRRQSKLSPLIFMPFLK